MKKSIILLIVLICTTMGSEPSLYAIGNDNIKHVHLIACEDSGIIIAAGNSCETGAGSCVPNGCPQQCPTQ
jgi:hypothetical protein